MRTKYALVGAGHRGLHMFAKPIVERFADTAELAGIYDPNPVRAAYVSEQCGGAPVYDSFDAMIRDSGAEKVIVTTVDSVHDEYIIRALRAGLDAITEKPMTTDETKCRAILRAERETGRTVTVTFNVRFIPYVRRIKELIRAGAVGEILSVNLEYMLDTKHGADYFRRWHRQMEHSGGLLVHKSTHQFDMVNWWLEDEPHRVYASGATRFYGPTRTERGVNCRTCEHTATCEFHFDIGNDAELVRMYADAEREDGYARDQCVFDDRITAYDTMSLNLEYARGANLTYTLNAHCPYEGWKVTVNGVAGRIEAEDYVHPLKADNANREIRVFNRQGEAVAHAVPIAAGVHGGGDERLQRALFGGEEAKAEFDRLPSSRDGALSLLIGVAANRSIARKQPVTIGELLAGE